MKKTVIDIKEMSDSKEVYGQRPNPFISIFIYCLVLLLFVALVYSFFGKIEIAATASGIIRPNDDVSTVSNLTGGRITGVFFSDGQFVRAGDTLLTIDASESQIVLNGLLNTKAEYRFREEMLSKFLNGIEAGDNPFSSDPDGDEYPYYVQYQDFELSMKDAQQNFDYDESRNASNMQAIQKQISETEYQISGLTYYRSSIEQGTNLAVDYPEYSNMYLLYEESLQALKNDYESQLEKIQSDMSFENSQYNLETYQEQLNGYNYLVASLEYGYSAFPLGDNSAYKMLYEDYEYRLTEYENAYNSARETYEYYLNGGNAGQSAATLLAYEQAMLEGYNYYLQSVRNDCDMFLDYRDSAYYRSLYKEYESQYAQLNDAVNGAQAVYAELLENAEASEEAITAAASAIASAQSKKDDFKKQTIASIQNSILQIEASIAEKEISIGSYSAGHNLSSSKIQMENALNAIESFKNSKLLEYRQTQAELSNKIAELTLTLSAVQSKDELLTALEQSYQNSVAQKRYQAITQIDNSIQSLNTELASARANLRLYQISAGLYARNTDDTGQPIAISLSTLERVSSLLSSLDTVSAQIQDISTQIQQTQEQINAAVITAEQSGVINAIATVVSGDVIPSGTTIATIIPNDESQYKTLIYVSSADIANIKTGAQIKYNISALPSNQYGTISGKVLSVSKDALVQDGQYSGYFLVEGSIGNYELIDKDGNAGSISIGMQTEAKIVTQEKSIFRYLLEKINLF